MKITIIKGAAIGATLAVTAIAGSAQAATLDILAENQTTVEVTAPLGAFGLGGAPTGSAAVSLTPAGNPLFAFNITGGTVDSDTGAAQIEHDGSGVRLFALANDTIGAIVGNFIVDTGVGAVFGNVNDDDAVVRLFDLDLGATGGIGLNISDDLAGALTTVFDADDLTGAQFGLANTNPTVAPAPIPLPAGAPLLLAGVGAFAIARRHQKAKAA